MATRERKATRSNTDSPTISNSSSRSDTASPVTVGARASAAAATKSKSETTTPVRNPLRSTRAGSVAQSQGGSPPDDGTEPVTEETAAEDTKSSTRSRPTRQTAAAAEDKATPSGRGIRKPVVANVHNIKRNSLPALVGRAAKMTTRRNSSGKMEAILKVCAEDDASALVSSKPKRGRPGAVGGNASSQNAVVTPSERRTLLRRKRALSADETTPGEKKDSEEADDSMAVEQEDDPEEEEEVEKKDSTAGARRRSVDSVASKCSEATDTQSLTSSEVKQDGEAAEVEVEEEEKKVVTTPRARVGGRKRKARGGKKSSPVKRAASGTPVDVKIKTEAVDEEDEEEAEEPEVAEGGEEEVEKEPQVESEKSKGEEETKEATADDETKVVGEESDSIAEGDDGEAKEQKDSEEKNKSDEKVDDSSPANGELTIKVEPADDEGVDADGGGGGEKGAAEKEIKDSSPSPNLPGDSSLSPVSVQQICGQPAFLENNPGIEKDPTVAAEMGAQVQEKIQAKEKEDAEQEDKEAKEEQKEGEKMDREETPADEGKENQNHVNVQAQDQEEEIAKENDEEKTKVDEAAEIKAKGTKPADDKLISPPPSTPTAVREIKKEPESPECSTKKENHLKVLGLFTLRAAEQAKCEKARRREILKAFPTPPSINLQQLSAGGDSDGGTSEGKGGSGKARGAGKEGGNGNQEYTGTLKTVIKLNRKNGNGASSAKGGQGGGGQAAGGGGGGGRQSLKMTFQKGRGKGAKENGAAGAGGVGGAGKDTRQSASEGEEYYTISKEGGGGAAGVGAGAGDKSGGKEGEKSMNSQLEPTGRKTNNRSQQINATDCGGSTHSGEDGARKEEKDLVVPEKAASFSIHPDRLCQDTCFYCGGKFGLFDTPLHIAQIKTQERQKKILDNEEKLTADSCLCDACYRHVDRRANCPSYKKRLSAPASLAIQQARQQQQQQQELDQQQDDSMEVDDQGQQQQGNKAGGDPKRNRANGHNCSLCRSKMSKNRSFPLNQNVKRLEDMIRNQGIAVNWGITPIVCKLCKFYTEHLSKELRGEPQDNSNSFAENYRRRLITFYKSEEAMRKNKRQQQHDQSRPGVGGGGQQQQSSASASGLEQSEASRALSRNPAISIRELFPGEDEMGLSVHLPFGQPGGIRTPEGWTRSYSLLQYDDQTRQLWEDLQRPYGNQSSFIRHLVLLEKYFRNGDLQLSKNASSSAATYSESVQTRLRAFDSSVSLENRTLLQQLSNAPITITQKPKQQPQPPVTITATPPVPATLPSPPPLVPTSSLAQQLVNNCNNNNGNNKLVVEAGTSLLKKTISSLPPDLISITPSQATLAAAANSGGGGDKQTTSLNTSSGGGGSGGPVPPPTVTPTTGSAAAGPSPNKRTGSPSKARETVVVTLPDTLSPSDRKLVNGKSWRPTLMPVERIELNEDGTRTMFKTADGRLLPSRVQVMSGGKPYHISIYDYNRMCILRREKLVQKAINGQKTGGGAGAGDAANTSTGSQSSASPPSVSPSGSSQTSAAAANGRMSGGGGGGQGQGQGQSQGRQTIVAPTVQIPNTVLEQNSFVPVTASGFLSMAPINGGQGGAGVQANGGVGALGTTTRRNSRSKSAVSGGGGGSAGLSVVNLGSQITATVTSGGGGGGGSNNNNGSSVVSEKDVAKVANHNWMWNPGDLSMDQVQPFQASAAVPLLDTSASSAATASLLSRIPKSLTVIPQQKLM